MADRDFIIKNGLRTVGNSFIANTSTVKLTANVLIDSAAGLNANGGYGTAGQVLSSNGSGVYWATASGGGGTPGGSNTQLQFNDSGAFNGTAGLTFDKTTNNVLIANTLTIGTGTINTTNYSGTSNNALYLGGTIASGYQTTGGLAANVLTFTSNNSLRLGGTLASGYQTTAGLSGAVALLTSNNSLRLGGLTADSYVTNVGTEYSLVANIAYTGIQRFTQNVVFSSSISANQSFGTAGQALLTGGSGANAYWGSVVTSVGAGGALSFSGTTAAPVISLNTTTVTAGSYTVPSITVDAYGRITAASSGTAGGGGTVTAVDTGDGLVVTGGVDANTITGTGTISLANLTSVSVDYGTAGLSKITVDKYGRVTSAVAATYLTTTDASTTYAPKASPTFTGTVSGVNSTMVGLGSVTNESKATMFTNPTFTGTVSGVTATMVGLGSVTNESKATMFTSPAFTGTVTVGANVTVNTSTIFVGNTINHITVNSTAIFTRTSSTVSNTISATELSYLDGVTSNIQTQFGAKVSSIGAGTGVTIGGTATIPTVTVNSAYIATITANNASFLGGVAASSYAPKASPTFTGTVTIPSGASISGYVTSVDAVSLFAPLASPTFTGIVQDGYGNLRSVPQNAKTSAYTLAATDNGRHISITTGGVTIPSGVFSVGDTVTIYNNSSSSQTITQGASATVYLVGTATTGDRTLAQRGLCTVLCVASSTFVITGGGIT